MIMIMIIMIVIVIVILILIVIVATRNLEASTNNIKPYPIDHDVTICNERVAAQLVPNVRNISTRL